MYLKTYIIFHEININFEATTSTTTIATLDEHTNITTPSINIASNVSEEVAGMHLFTEVLKLVKLRVRK